MEITVNMYGYVTNEAGEEVSKMTKDVSKAQRAVCYFDTNNTDADDATFKQAFVDMAKKHNFTGDCKLTKDENGWKIEKSGSVVWS